MEPTEDTWRALARSSPWRWRTLHFTRTTERGTVEAWVRRPGQMRVRDERGRVSYHSEPSESASQRALTSVYTWGPFRSRESRVPPEARADDREPTYRPDGLVAVRPGDKFDHDDPMHHSYDWVAMLDPLELSHHTTVTGLRPDALHGRAVWRAMVRAEEDYDPRCTCCALLWSEVSHRQDCEESGTDFEPQESYPDGYQVALDLQTGVVVDLRPVGGGPDELTFSVRIHDVDESMDELFAGR